MPTVPEFMLRKLFVKDSLKSSDSGFSFELFNSFAPLTFQAFALEVDGNAVPAQEIRLQTGLNPEVTAAQITSENPFNLAIGERVFVRVKEMLIGNGDLRISTTTREVGVLSFGVKTGQEQNAPSRKSTPLRLPRLFQKPQKTEVRLDYDDILAEIDPNIYGQFVEHLEHCVYGGIWTEDGSALRQDTLALIKTLQPPLIRYPGGNFASGYHWEDGIGPIENRPERFDQAWKSTERNRVGTDEFMAFCHAVGAAPFLVVNDGSGTPEEAARWVAYCNEPADGEQGRRRAANGHPEPYNVKLWGIGNEVWGAWQIGHTGPEAYTHRLRRFAEAMRAVDPAIQLVAVGDKVMSDKPDDPGALWNECVLREAGDLIDYLSFHIYQPGQEGWQEAYDPDALHHTVCAAPLEVEQIIRRIAAQITALVPERQIKIALDEWNLWLPPPESATSMHQVVYTMRDALYAAGMLNVFQRQGAVLKIANLAQLVNVLPLIVTPSEVDDAAYATPIYYPFVLYRQMEKLALRVHVRGKFYDSKRLGNIPAMKDVPYIDVAATRNETGSRVVLSVVNRHPTNRIFVDIELNGFEQMRLAEGWLLHNQDAQAANSRTEPERVKAKQVSLPDKRGSRFRLDLPQASVSILALEKM